MSKSYKESSKAKRTEAKRILTKDQLLKCHAIIHTAAAASFAAGAIPIPVADAIPISGAQIAMVLGLGKVFHQSVGASSAKGAISSAASTFIGRNLVKSIPVVGWGISAGVAAGITEAIGWGFAVDFAKGNYVGGYEAGCNDTSKTYKAKFTKQAEDFVRQYEEWEKTDRERGQIFEEIQKVNEECLKYINDLENERDALYAENKRLSKEKEDLLKKLYRIRPLMLA